MKKTVKLSGKDLTIRYEIPKLQKTKQVRECSASVMYVTVCGGCHTGC